MAGKVLGPIEWGLTRNEDGFRDYNISLLVRTDSVFDGPAVAANADGVYALGALWSPTDAESDPYCFCRPEMTVEQFGKPDNEPGDLWKVSQVFSNRPLPESTQFDNPLAQPPRTSGSFIKFTKQISRDKDDKLIASSTYEPFNWEVDDNRPTVQIELTLSSLPLATYAQMVDRVNDSAMWGVSARCVKLSNIRWQRHSHQTVGFYYTVAYEFEIDFDTFDYKTWDYGTKKLKEGGTSTNPSHYIVAQDDNGNVTPFLLNGSGAPLTDGANPVLKTFKHYPEANFLSLGIPSLL